MKGKVDELGRIKRDKEDKQHQNSKNNEQWTRKQLQNWSKKNMIKIQKEGEVEDENVANQAKAMFEKRILKRKGFKFDRDQSQDKVLKYQREHRIRSELKGAKEIMNVMTQPNSRPHTEMPVSILMRAPFYLNDKRGGCRSPTHRAPALN